MAWNMFYFVSYDTFQIPSTRNIPFHESSNDQWARSLKARNYIPVILPPGQKEADFWEMGHSLLEKTTKEGLTADI